MKSILSAIALVAALGLAGGVAAQDAMSTPMQDNAMSGGAMAPDAMMMTPDQMLAACVEKAGAAADAMKQDEDKKMCQGAYDLLMGDQAMTSEPMANDAMAAEPMAPAQ